MSQRYEIKIPIDENNFVKYKNWLLELKGVSSAYSDRIINSIYFDSINYDSALANLSGLSNRMKYRIRWYGDDVESDTFAEIKIKSGRIGKKIVLPTKKKFKDLNIENAFLAHNLWFRDSKDLSVIPLITTTSLQPVLHVRYNRSYYIFENFIRLTFDLLPNYRIFKNKHSKNYWKQDTFSVLEIKFNKDNLPKAKKFLSKLPFVHKRNSKYLRGLSYCDKAIYI